MAPSQKTKLVKTPPATQGSLQHPAAAVSQDDYQKSQHVVIGSILYSVGNGELRVGNLIDFLYYFRSNIFIILLALTSENPIPRFSNFQKLSPKEEDTS